MRAQSSRTISGALTALAMLVTAFGPASASFAKADTAPVTRSFVINEINWAGSAGSAADQWVEFYNNSGATIDFAATPYHLYAGSSDVVDLTAGSMPAGAFYLVSALGGGSPLTTLALAPDAAAHPLLSLLPSGQLLTLRDDAGNVIDEAVTGLAGTASAAGVPAAGQERVSLATDGAAAAAWGTSHTIGHNFLSTVGDATHVAQYGTPETPFTAALAAGSMVTNPQLATPVATVSSADPVLGTNPTVSGTVVPKAGENAAAWVSLTATDVVTGLSQSFAPVSVDPLTSAFTVPTAISAAGIYRFSVQATAAVAPGYVTADRGTVTTVSTGTAQNLYEVKSAAVTVVPPTLDAYDAYTTATTVTLTGTVVQPGTALVVSVNGSQVSQDMLPVGQTTFSLPVTLQPNAVNAIEVRARDAAGTFSSPVVATITNDTDAPVVTAAISAQPVGTADMVVGTVQDLTPSVVYAYSDAAMTKQIAQATPASDGSFSLNIGDNAYATVYVSAKDSLGNVSAAVVVANPVAFVAAPSFTVSGIGSTQLTLTVTPVTGAVNYLLKYKAGTGAYSAPIALCADISTCLLERQIVNLSASTSYTFAVAAVDKLGNQTAYVERAATTLAPAVVTAVSETPAATPAPAAPAPVASTYVAPSPAVTTEVTPTPAPSASPEVGQVESANTDTSRNYTPWIILAVLIALAILATAGYFYWFGGEAGSAVEAASATPATAPEKEKPKASKPAADTPDPTPPPKKDKRW